MHTNDEVVVALNEELLVERIVRAQRRVCFVAPGLYDWVAEALVDAGTRIGWERVHVIVDPDPHVIQIGYGTEEALKRICDSGGKLRKASRLRLGVVITDERAAVFTPIALNVDEFPKQELCSNAIELSVREANRIVEAFAPENIAGEPQQLAEIGQEDLNSADLQVLREVLTEAPPVAPDLARQMQVLNSQIQIVKIAFEGARPSQRRVPLRADHLGIEDADLVRRVSGSFKLFEAEIDQLLGPVREDLERIKKQYDLKPLGDLGHVVLARDRSNLERALQTFKSNLETCKKQIEQDLQEDLNSSRERLKKMLASKLHEPQLSEAALERRLNYIVASMKFPTATKMVSQIAFDWSFLNITGQMIAKESFSERIRNFYGKSIQELAAFEWAVGVKGIKAVSK